MYSECSRALATRSAASREMKQISWNRNEDAKRLKAFSASPPYISVHLELHFQDVRELLFQTIKKET